MAYEPTNWKTGDVVTSAKLNKLENGVAAASSGGGLLAVNVTESVEDGSAIYTMDKTAGELFEAGKSNFIVALNETLVGTSTDYITHSENYEEEYVFRLNNGAEYIAEAASDYPRRTGGK